MMMHTAWLVATRWRAASSPASTLLPVWTMVHVIKRVHAWTVKGQEVSAEVNKVVRSFFFGVLHRSKGDSKLPTKRLDRIVRSYDDMHEAWLVPS
jgi:hypothetical protein